MFHYRRPDGSESEPLDLAALVELARAGVLSEETPVREAGGAAWTPAWRVPVLQPVFGLGAAAAPANAATARSEGSARPNPGAECPPDAPTAVAAAAPRAAGIDRRKVLLFLLPVAVVFSLARILLAAPTLTTRDGRMQLTLGSGWTVRQPDPGLELQADTDGRETVVLAGSVPISPDEPPMSLEAFDYALIQGPAGESPDFQDLGTRTYTAGGLQFLRHDFRGTLNGRTGRFILVSTKTAGAFYRLVACTSADLADRRKADLERIVESFRPAGK